MRNCKKTEVGVANSTAYEMLCPLCEARLVKGNPCRYETLDEHVCNPDGIIPIRNTLVCSNHACATYGTETFWANDGEGPFGTKLKDCEWIDSNPLPFNSCHRSIHFQVSYHEEDRRFKFGKLTIRREVSYKSDDFGHKRNKHVRYTIWWNNTLYQSGLKMLLFSIRYFYRMKKLGKDAAIEEARSLRGRASWPRAEWWRKVSFLWIRVFHSSICSQLPSPKGEGPHAGDI